MIVNNKVLKSILIIVLSFLSLVHIQKIIFVGIGINQTALLGFILFGIAIFKENNFLYSLSIFYQGFIHVLFNENITISPALIFFIVLIYCSNMKMIIAIIITVPTLLTLSFFIFNRTDFYNLAILIIGNLGLLTFLYFAVINKPVKTKPPQLSDIDKNKILLFIMGKTPEQIIKELELSVQPRTVRTFILDQVKDSPCINEMEYAIYFCKMNKIDINLINSI